MKKILFADADPTTRRVISLILEDEYQVNLLSSGDRIMTDKYEIPDLFLLDKNLLGTDALEICRFLKADQKTRNIPVIIISDVPGILSLAKSAGADFAIEKPFDVRALREVIASYANAQPKTLP